MASVGARRLGPALHDLCQMPLGISSADTRHLDAIEAHDLQDNRHRRLGMPAAGSYRFLDEQPLAMLNSGHKMPLVGLGTWKSGRGEVQKAVAAALLAGYRHIDCAYVYQNEHEVGAALCNVLCEGVLQRQDIFVTSKLWKHVWLAISQTHIPRFKPVEGTCTTVVNKAKEGNTDHAGDRVRTACLRSMRDLGLNYLDLYLVHWPHNGTAGLSMLPSLVETWAAMEALVTEGLVRAIGVSNFSAVKLHHLLDHANIPPAVCQVEVHPAFRNDDLIKFCTKHSIHVTAFSPLGSPDSAAIMQRSQSPSLLQDPVVLQVARRVGKDVGQVLIRWGLQHGTSVLAKSVTASRIKSNIEVLDWQLDPEDFQALCRLPVQIRAVDGRFLLSDQGPYHTLADLWDEPWQPQPDASAARDAYNLEVACPRATLSTGARIPLLGLGTWKAGKGEVRSAVAAALRAGCRHVDAAEVYRNEHEVGEALAEVFCEDVLSRSDIFVTSKLWNSDHGATRVEAAVRKSLRALQVSYLDLYLIHWPATGNRGAEVSPPLAETWAALERLQQAGLVKAIGVSNFSILKLQRLLATASIRPAVVQVEVHPYHRNDELIRFCSRHGIHVTAYSPLGSPDSAGIMQRGAGCPVLMQDPVVQDVAARLGKSTAQVLIRWALQHGTSALAKSVKPERIKANLDVTGWQLPENDYLNLCRLRPQLRMVDGAFLLHPTGPYRTLAELWDVDGEQHAASS